MIQKQKNNKLLQLKNINYHYKDHRVLKDINLDVKKGVIHAVLGGTGSGKSSVGMIITGALKPKSGKIVFNHNEYDVLNLKKSHHLGIEMLYQNLYILDSFLVAEALLLPTKYDHILHFINRAKMIETAQSFLLQYGFQIDASMQLKELTLQDQLIISLLKTLYQKPQLLILDEPFNNLSPLAVNKVINLLKKIKYEEGTSILFLTKSIDDIYNFSDYVSILKDGEMLLSDNTRYVERSDLIHLIYNEIAKKSSIKDIKQEFYQLLKYNVSILQNLPINLIVTDPNNNVKIINKYATKYFQLEGHDLSNTSIESLFRFCEGEDAELIRSVLSDKKERSINNITLQINDSKTINNIIVFPIMDGSYFIGNIVIVEDITEREKLKEQIILSENMSSVGLLAAGVAHEINSPLEVISNYANYLMLNPQKGEIESIVHEIQEEVRYISSVIGNLMSFSESGTYFREEVDLNATIDRLLNLIRYKAKSRNIKIKFKSCKENIYFNANENEIRLVLLNLIKNSFDAMPNGGNIYIETDEINISQNKNVRITLRDSGEGIDENNLSDIFLPFFSTKKENGNNVGLGLYVCYIIIKKYNGSLSVKNIENSGCEFSITIPKYC